MGAGGGAKGEAMRFVAGVLVLFGCGAPTGPVAPVGAIADGGYDAQGAWDAETDGAFPQDAQAAPDSGAVDAAPDAAPEPDAEVACHPDSCAYGCPCEPGDAIWCDPPDIDMGGGHGAWAVADNGTRRCNPDGRWGDCNASPAHTIDFDWSDYTPCTNEPGDPQCQPTLRANVSACRDPEMPERSCNTDADCSGPKRCGLHTDSQGGAFWKGSCVWICPDKRPNPSGEPGDPIAPPGFGGPSGACFNGN